MSAIFSAATMISIIIPTLEEEKIIGQTLARLEAGLTLPHEIIISDGGSKDNTVAIAKTFTDKVIVYDGAARQTIAQGRNDGTKLAAGEFLVFLDADCEIPEANDFFRTALARFEEDKRLVALTGYLRVFPEDETLRDRIFFALMNSAVRFRNNILAKGDCAGGEFQMVRRNAFAAVKGYREDLVTREDRDLFTRLSQSGRTFCDPNLIIFHSGRRAHRVGWARLIALFLINTISFHLRGRVVSKEWKPIR